MRALLVLILSFLCAGVALAEAFRCPTCEVRYGRSGYCSADGAQLEVVPTDDAKAPTRVCRTCSTRYADGSSFCARDGEQLAALETETRKGEVPHVKAGQDYVYELVAGPTLSRMIYRVTKVEEGVITYELISVIHMDGEFKEFPAGGEQVWPPEAVAQPMEGAPQVDTKELPTETLEVSGRSFVCKVTETELPGGAGRSKVWVPVDSKGELTFPPALRVETTGGAMDTRMSLVAIVQR